MTLPNFLRLPNMGLAPRLVALAVLVASLVGGSVAASVISSARAALRDEILGTQLVLADLIAGQIAGYVADVQVDATDLADRAPVKQAVESNDYSNLETQLAKWQANRRSKIDGLAVYSTDGTMLATAHANRAHIGIAANNTEAILRVANTGRPDRGVALWSKTTGHPIVPILIPVRSATGEVGAVLSATLSLESLTETLLALQLAPNSRVSVIDNTSGLLAATAKGRWRPIRRCPGYRGACFSRNRPPRHSRQSRT